MSIRMIKAAIVALSLTALGPAVASADSLENITKTGVIRIAVPEDFSGYGMMGPDLKPVGYDVDVAAYVARKLGATLELVPVGGANRIPALQTNKADLIIAVLGKNAEREAVIDFTNAYGILNNSVFAEAGTKISGPADLAGKSVSALRGGIADTLLTEVAPPKATIKRYEDENGNTQAFLSGQVDAIATGDLIINALVARKPARVPVEKFILNKSPLHIGVKKGEKALVERVNKIIAEMIADGSLRTASQKWLGRDLPEKF
jgi:polar amino acid transport system substrate-binding protein